MSTGNRVWSYTHQGFWSKMSCGATRLPSGNTLICDSDFGNFFEVTPDGTSVWQYHAQDYDGKVFKIDYMTPNQNQVDCIGSLSWDDIEPNSTVTGSFVIRSKGQIPLSWNISEYPEWGTWDFSESSGVVGEEIDITVSVVVPMQEDADLKAS